MKINELDKTMMNDWPFLITTDISVLSLVMLAICIICLKLTWQINAKYQKVSKQLLHVQNELRGMSSGHLGMGREIRKALKNIADVETLQEQVSCSGTSEKTYQQAGLLLARGATIEEVVESFEIAPAEAELLAIMHHSAPRAC